MRKAWILGIALALMPVVAVAVNRQEARKHIESSMLLSGVVAIDAGGNVTGSEIDQAKELAPMFLDIVRNNVASLKFEPVVRAGKAVPARSKMSLRLVAKELDNGDFTLQIRSANFSGEPPKAGEVLVSKSLEPPRYPKIAAMSGISGAVYVVVKVGPSGHVDDAVAEQVNLRTLGNEKQMARMRDILVEAALEAAKRWVFVPPTQGEEADDEFWSARVPVDFRLESGDLVTYGKWHAYIPGPRQRIPWSQEEQSGFSPDVLADGGIYMLKPGDAPKLLTKLGGDI